MNIQSHKRITVPKSSIYDSFRNTIVINAFDNGDNVIHKIRKHFQRLRNQLFIDTVDYRRTIFLAGTGRSGTTWVQEVINARNDFRIMFEPFHSKKVDLVRDWNYRQYLRCNDRGDKFLKPATSILSGNIKHKWIDRFNRKFYPRKRLIKDIRAQLFLKWIKHHFSEIPIILLLRHPCAVANSKLKLGWETHLNDFLIQDELMEDFLNPFKKEIESAQNTFDKHIFMWCIENYVPLRQFSGGEVLVIFYEYLCTNPQKEIENILSFIGEDFSSEMIEQSTKPSSLSRKDSPICSRSDLVNSWRKSISNKQTERAMEICSIFGLQKIYDKSGFPLLSGKEALSLLPV